VSVVLVVEDEEQVRVLAESFLQGEGHKTLSAATTGQALVLLEGDEPIDLMFIDLGMHSDPEAGLKVAKKAAEVRPNLKVLYTSGHLSKPDRRNRQAVISLVCQKTYY
jgi:CheY-like chemotaxis protein